MRLLAASALLILLLAAPPVAAAGPTVGDVLAAVEDVQDGLQGGNVSASDLESRLDAARSDLETLGPGDVSRDELEALGTRLAALRADVEAQGGNASGDLDIRIQALQGRVGELKEAQATPTPTATSVPRRAVSRSGGGPQEWEARVGRSALLVSHVFRDGRFHLRIYSEVPQRLMLSDAFTGINSNSETGENYAEPRTVSRGYSNISFPATTWRGDARITVSGRGGGAFVQRQTASALFEGPSTWRYVQVAAATGAATMIALIALVAWRRRRGSDDVERVV